MFLVKTTDGEQHPFPSTDEFGWQLMEGCLNILSRLKEPQKAKNEKGEEVEVNFIAIAVFPLHSVRFFRVVPDPPQEKKIVEVVPGSGLPPRFRPPMRGVPS